MELELLLEAMNTVINVRSYTNQPIPDDVMEKLFSAFSLGPSLANTQPWELIVVEDPENRKRVADATLDPFLTPDTYGAQTWVMDSPLLVVVTLEMRRAMARLGDNGILLAVEDTFCAIQNFRVVAALSDLSTSCVREFDESRLRSNLGLPWYVKPIAILVAGYSNEMKEFPPRLSVSDFVHKEIAR